MSALLNPIELVEATQYPWFALRVRSRFEKTTATVLREKGYEEFSPLYRSRRRWSDRVKELDLPLFPGYIFCRFNPLNRLPILSSAGVVSIVSLGKIPLPVGDQEIAQIQAIVKSGVPAEPWPFLRIGQTVRITNGALYGVEGLLLNLKSRYRLVVSVSILQRSVSVEVDRRDIEPVL